jgi:uncharacterized membrane protein
MREDNFMFILVGVAAIVVVMLAYASLDEGCSKRGGVLVRTGDTWIGYTCLQVKELK